MQLVEDRWYAYFTRAVTGVALVLFVACVIEAFLPSIAPQATKFGLSYITLGLAALQLLFMLFVYPILLRKNGIFSASLVLSFVFMMNLVNLIHSTGRLHSWYHVIWMTLVFASGMFGAYMIVGLCFLTMLYMLLIATDIPGMLVFEPFSMVAAVAVFIIGFLSYLFWRKRYVNNENTRIAQLTGMLNTKQQQSEILIESIADGIIVIGTNGKISLINPSAAAMTEWPVEEAVGIDVQLVLKLSLENGKDLAQSDNPFVKVFVAKEHQNDTLQLVGRNGKNQIVSLAVSPIVDKKSQELTGAVAVMRDISAARAEEQRRADFISTASHEMRTPVAAIEGYLALALNDKVSQIDQKARGYLEKAHASTQHLGKLFQDLLTSAKAEDGRLVNHPTVVEMGAYLEQVSDSLKFSAEKKGLLTDFTIGVSQADNNAVGGVKVVKPLYYVHVDADRMREVITNLFDNAVKYTETGKISIGLTGNTDVVQLFIKDTGPGIGPEDVSHLFQKFYRVDNSSTRTIGGTGLGLFICKKIVELYKGRIWVESTVGQGSTFFINLPRLSSQKAAELQAAEAANASVLSS